MKTVYAYVVIDKKGRICTLSSTRREARADVWEAGDLIIQVPLDMKKGKVVR